MNKLALSLLTTFIATCMVGCGSEDIDDDNIVQVKPSSIVDSEPFSKEGNTPKILEKSKTDSNNISIPIHILSDNSKEVKYIEVSKNSTIEEKIECIVNILSKECFNGLPMKVTVYVKNNTAKVELIEPEKTSNSMISWKKDYLNGKTKAYTINTIIKNIMQEDYKGEWINKIQLYYKDKLISLD